MKRSTTIGLMSVAAVLAAAGCASGPRTPDEFRVVRKAPLTVPPDFNLRPPAPGESRPQDLSQDAQARVAVFGVDTGRDASAGEKLFVQQAGGDATDRNIRGTVDFDSAQLVRKNRSFADSILNFGKPNVQNGPTLDPAAEAERIRSEKESLADVTGGKDVVIKRKGSGKLPGL